MRAALAIFTLVLSAAVLLVSGPALAQLTSVDSTSVDSTSVDSTSVDSTSVDSRADDGREPSRMLLLGDSIGASMGAALAERLAAEGWQFSYAGFPASGPLTHQGEFWKAQLDAALGDFDPDVVVIQGSGCYALFHDPAYVTFDGRQLEQGSVEFFDLWNAHLAELVARIDAHGATPVILTAPAAADDAHTHRFWAEHNAGYREVAAATGAVLLEWNDLLAPAGSFSQTIEFFGSEVRVREPDGIHLTAEGINLSAAWLVDELVDLRRGAENSATGQRPAVRLR